MCHGYVALLGSDDQVNQGSNLLACSYRILVVTMTPRRQSWGWNLVDNHLLHNGDSQGNYPQLNNAPKYQVRRRRGRQHPTHPGRREDTSHSGL